MALPREIVLPGRLILRSLIMTSASSPAERLTNLLRARAFPSVLLEAR